MTQIPEEFKPFIRYLNVARTLEAKSEPTALILKLAFVNSCQELRDDGNCSETACDWLDQYQESLREPTDADVDAARSFADTLYNTLTKEAESGVQNWKPTLPQQFIILSLIYSVFSDNEADDRSNKCRVVAAKVKKTLADKANFMASQANAEQPPQETPQPQTGGFQQYPPGHPYYVPPEEPEPQTPIQPPNLQPVMPQGPSDIAPIQPPNLQPITPQAPSQPPQDPAPAPPPAQAPAPQPKPEAVLSVPGCTYDRGPALEYFEKEGIKLVTKVYPQPDEQCKSAIIRYLNYTVSRLKADEYEQPYAFISNALKSWKTGKPQ